MSWSAPEYLYTVLTRNRTALPKVRRHAAIDTCSLPSFLHGHGYVLYDAIALPFDFGPSAADVLLGGPLGPCRRRCSCCATTSS